MTSPATATTTTTSPKASPTPAILGHLDVSFLPENARSRNKRFYPAETVRRTVQMAQEDLAKGVPLTNFALHADGLADDASKMTGRISHVWMEGAKARARIDILNTQKGRDIAAVARAGGIKTVSLRSADYRASPKVERAGGKSDAYEEVEHCRIAGIDFAPMPGIEDATVDAVVLESFKRAQEQAAHEGRLLEAMEAADVAYEAALEAWALPEVLEGWLPAGVTQGDLDNGDFAWISDDGKTRKLPFKIHGKVSERGWRAAWNAVHGARGGMDCSGGPSKEATIKKLLATKPKGVQVSATEAVTYQPCANPACNPMVCLCGAECACTESASCCSPGTTTMEEPDVAVFTTEELDAMLAKAATAGATAALTEHQKAITASYQPPLVEARHTHDHTHTNADGTTYSHDHAHMHDGAVDHGNAMAHMHGHGSAYESAGGHAHPQESPATEAGGQNQPTTTTTEGATEEMKAEDVQALLTEQIATLRTELTEAQTAQQKTLTEQYEAKLTEAQAALKEAQEAAEKAQQERDTLKQMIGENWRTRRRVPVESFAPLLESEGDREVSLEEQGKIAMQVYRESVARAVLAGR